MKEEGRFIAFEGIDGVGGTTQSTLLAEYLSNLIFSKKDIGSVILTKEPTNSKYGREIRKMLGQNIDPIQYAKEYLNLFLEDRKYHVENLILPNLKEKNIIISDRYYHSTIAYQAAQGIKTVKELIKMNKDFIKPDLTIILDMPVKDALKRNKKTESFEKEEFLERVRKNYKDLEKKLPDEEIYIVDASRPIKIVQEEIHFYIRNKILKNFLN